MRGSPYKIASLESLASMRQQTAWPGYRNVQDFHGGAYDSLHVSPYTRGAGNCDASVFLVLQDWCSIKHLEKPVNSSMVELGRNPTLPTNKNLTVLLRRHLGTTLDDCYATNVMPFIKPGKISSKLRREDLRRCAVKFTVPQIEIVKPRHVICLGVEVFRALRYAHRLQMTLGKGSPVGRCYSKDGLMMWCQSHPGGLDVANRGGMANMHVDWRKMVVSPEW